MATKIFGIIAMVLGVIAAPISGYLAGESTLRVAIAASFTALMAWFMRSPFAAKLEKELLEDDAPAQPPAAPTPPTEPPVGV